MTSATTSSTLVQKAFASLANVGLAFVVSLPVGYAFGFGFEWKIAMISMFFIYNVVTVFTPGFRGLGMRGVGTQWERNYPWWQRILYSIFYTASLATLLFWMFFPLDIFILNMIAQLVAVRLTGTTVHGLLAGGMRSVQYK